LVGFFESDSETRLGVGEALKEMTWEMTSNLINRMRGPVMETYKRGGEGGCGSYWSIAGLKSDHAVPLGK